MNKQRFLKVLKNPDDIKDELSNLQQLQATYPYAQAIHVLVALAHKQHNSSEAGSSLNNAAMHVVDRHNLKELIKSEAPFKKEIHSASGPAENIDVRNANEAVKRKDNLEDADTPARPHRAQMTVTHKGGKTAELQQEKSKKETDGKEALNPKTLASEISNKFRENLIKKLEKLQAAKARWTGGNTADELKEKATIADKLFKGSGKVKSGKQTKEKKKTDKKRAKRTNTDNVSTQSSEPDKIKQQQDLISKFIEVSPSIKAKATKPPVISSSQEDLSVPSTSFKDNLISENLADIMVSQGKDDKAVDIYKKLIWKFPQKKAYFASRIEELTKKKG